MSEPNETKRIILLSTGGTIEKTYDEGDGSLLNRASVIRNEILKKLRLPYAEVDVTAILAKDSLYMTDEDRALIAAAIRERLKQKAPIVVLHGTDTMARTLTYCWETIHTVEVPVIFTGAMRPLEFAMSDGLQNVTEALLAAKLLPAGFYISFHNRIFEAPHVRKNSDKHTFEAF